MTAPHLSRLIENRRANLRRLASQYGTLTLAERLGYKSGSFLSQMIGPNPKRVITERTARVIEHELGMRPGTLDMPEDSRARPARA